MRMMIYRILVVVFAILHIPPPDYVDHYGCHYKIDYQGTWRRRKV